MTQTNQQPAQPASLDAFVNRDPKRIYTAMEIVAAAENLFDKSPAAAMLGFYLARSMIPPDAQEARTAFDKYLGVYEKLFMDQTSTQTRTSGVGTRGGNLDYSAGKTTSLYKG